jgi:hypothetical protein
MAEKVRDGVDGAPLPDRQRSRPRRQRLRPSSPSGSPSNPRRSTSPPRMRLCWTPIWESTAGPAPSGNLDERRIPRLLT